MRGGLLHCAKINPVRPPGDQRRIFIEGFRQNLYCAAIGSNHSNSRVGVEEIPRARGSVEGNSFPVRRPVRIPVRPRRAHNLSYRLVVHVDDVKVRRLSRDQIRVLLRAERYARSVRRPRKIFHAELVPFRQRFGLRCRRASVRKLDKPKMRHLIITMHHGIVAIPFFAVLQRLAFRVAHGKSDALRIRSPFKIAYVVLHFSDLLRFAAIR